MYRVWSCSDWPHFIAGWIPRRSENQQRAGPEFGGGHWQDNGGVAAGRAHDWQGIARKVKSTYRSSTRQVGCPSKVQQLKNKILSIRATSYRRRNNEIPPVRTIFSVIRNSILQFSFKWEASQSRSLTPLIRLLMSFTLPKKVRKLISKLSSR